LARRDHDDLDRALVAMVGPDMPARELANLLDIFRLGLAVHLVAQSRVFATLVTLVRPPPPLRSQIAELGREHALQRATADRLVNLTPGSDEWFSGALELRVLVLDHAKREDYLRGVLEDYVPTAIGRGLVAQYATERMKLLGSTSPLALARSVNAA
jgi:hypothetical protein